jgi:hypothetical protein
MYVPAIVELTVRVAVPEPVTLVGIMVALSPVGVVRVNVTVPLNPLTAVIVIVDAPLTPGVVLTGLGLEVIWKSVTLMANAALVLLA